MQLSPTYRALLRIIPDLSWVYRFIPQLGRGRCPWVHGLTKTGQKISRFLKKGLIPFHIWVSDSEIVSRDRDRIYTVSQDECTCPEWQHRISKGKGYRNIPELFKGYVDICKHQVMQRLRMHDVSHFSEFVIKQPKNSIESLLNSEVPEGIKISKSEDSDGYFWGLSVQFNYWKPPKTEYGEYEKKRRFLGFLKICERKHPHADIGDIEVFFSRKGLAGLGKGFESLDDAIDYLLKYHRLKREMAEEPEEIKAKNSLFWNEPEPEPEPEYPMQDLNNDYNGFYCDSEREADENETEYPMAAYFEEEKREESKPKKKWISLADLRAL